MKDGGFKNDYRNTCIAKWTKHWWYTLFLIDFMSIKGSPWVACELRLRIKEKAIHRR